MAASDAVWGIDIGHCALKAVRCRLADDGQRLQAEAFDYIEYPKLLTQPDADPDELVRDALKQFLADNSVRDARIAVSVSGQSGLARFIKLPPVEAKKIPDIVKYEAKQQIPFSLDDVIWDYQALVGGRDNGVALETEVGLFAMKREQVFRAIRPFRHAGVELDLVQLTPIAIYNMVLYDLLEETLPPPEQYDPDNPPPSVVVISMGTDTTDLVITDGFRIWQRSIPIGGSHFTKQLTKELKLTFAKAEHLKRHAREAKDPKRVFQAMRPVFNDLVQELQRSIGYFQSLDRTARIEKGIAVGNAMRLPGLHPYVEKHLGIPIKKIEKFEKLTGKAITSVPKFKENILAFPVAYGLCIQGLNKARLRTNLIPRELVTSRIVRRKKPWVVAAVAVMLLAITFNYVFTWSRWRAAEPKRFETVASQVQAVSKQSKQFMERDEQLTAEFERLKKLGADVVGGADARFLVLELFTAIDQALPRDPDVDPFSVSDKPYMQRPELFIDYIDSEFFPTLADYYTPDIRDRYVQFLKDLAYSKKREAQGTTGGPPATGTAAATDADAPSPTLDNGDTANESLAADTEGVDGADSVEVSEPQLPDLGRAGWVIEIKGFHFHNDDMFHQRAQYVVDTLMNNLENGEVELPAGPGQPPTRFTMKELGIHAPILATPGQDITVAVPNPKYTGPPSSQTGGRRESVSRPADPNGEPEFLLIPAYEFTVQFMWIETRASERIEARKKKEQQASQPTDDVASQL